MIAFIVHKRRDRGFGGKVKQEPEAGKGRLEMVQ